MWSTIGDTMVQYKKNEKITKWGVGNSIKKKNPTKTKSVTTVTLTVNISTSKQAYTHFSESK